MFFWPKTQKSHVSETTVLTFVSLANQKIHFQFGVTLKHVGGLNTVCERVSIIKGLEVEPEVSLVSYQWRSSCHQQGQCKYLKECHDLKLYLWNFDMFVILV